MNMISCRWIFAAAIFGFLAAPLRAEHDWMQWRGPNFNGSSEATNLPDSIDKDKAAWTTKIPGVGNGSPVVAGDRIFVSCADPQSSKLLGVCISKTDGHILWQKEVGIGFNKNNRNDAASPSAVTDGKLVYFYFSTGDLAAFDVEGKPVWHRNIQKDFGNFSIQWIYSSSPLLYKGKLYVQVLQREKDSYLIALNPNTGADLWKVIRPTDAVAETRESYATPTPFEDNGHTEILLVGGDCVTCHDAETGKELWRAGGWNPAHIGHWRLVPSVTADPKDNLVFACAPKGGPVMAISAGGSGDVTTTHFAWKSDGKSSGITSDVCVPLLYKGNLYILNDSKKVMYCLDPKNASVKWSGDLGGKSPFRASATAADGKIYCMNEVGDVWVLAADAFKILSHTSFEATPSRGTIAVTDGTVIIRSGEKLYGFKK
jgi:outer membrane protein assembly factor BamB